LSFAFRWFKFVTAIVSNVAVNVNTNTNTNTDSIL